MREARRLLEMDRLQFARVLGYTGTDRNDTMRIRKMENNNQQVPLYIARLVWLLSEWHRCTERLPPFPEWPGYEFDHAPDLAHREASDAVEP